MPQALLEAKNVPFEAPSERGSPCEYTRSQIHGDCGAESVEIPATPPKCARRNWKNVPCKVDCRRPNSAPRSRQNRSSSTTPERRRQGQSVAVTRSLSSLPQSERSSSTGRVGRVASMSRIGRERPNKIEEMKRRKEALLTVQREAAIALRKSQYSNMRQSWAREHERYMKERSSKKSMNVKPNRPSNRELLNSWVSSEAPSTARLDRDAAYLTMELNALDARLRQKHKRGGSGIQKEAPALLTKHADVTVDLSTSIASHGVPGASYMENTLDSSLPTAPFPIPSISPVKRPQNSSRLTTGGNPNPALSSAASATVNTSVDEVDQAKWHPPDSVDGVPVFRLTLEPSGQLVEDASPPGGDCEDMESFSPAGSAEFGEGLLLTRGGFRKAPVPVEEPGCPTESLMRNRIRSASDISDDMKSEIRKRVEDRTAAWRVRLLNAISGGTAPEDGTTERMRDTQDLPAHQTDTDAHRPEQPERPVRESSSPSFDVQLTSLGLQVPPSGAISTNSPRQEDGESDSPCTDSVSEAESVEGEPDATSEAEGDVVLGSMANSAACDLSGVDIEFVSHERRELETVVNSLKREVEGLREERSLLQAEQESFRDVLRQRSDVEKEGPEASEQTSEVIVDGGKETQDASRTPRTEAEITQLRTERDELRARMLRRPMYRSMDDSFFDVRVADGGVISAAAVSGQSTAQSGNRNNETSLRVREERSLSETLRMQNIALRAEVAELKHCLFRVRAERVKLGGEKQSVENDLANVRMEHHTLRTQHAHLRKKVFILEQKLETLRRNQLSPTRATKSPRSSASRPRAPAVHNAQEHTIYKPSPPSNEGRSDSPEQNGPSSGHPAAEDPMHMDMNHTRSPSEGRSDSRQSPGSHDQHARPSSSLERHVRIRVPSPSSRHPDKPSGAVRIEAQRSFVPHGSPHTSSRRHPAARPGPPANPTQAHAQAQAQAQVQASIQRAAKAATPPKTSPPAKTVANGSPSPPPSSSSPSTVLFTNRLSSPVRSATGLLAAMRRKSKGQSPELTAVSVS
eukprot:Rmarinus@m.22588